MLDKKIKKNLQNEFQKMAPKIPTPSSDKSHSNEQSEQGTEEDSTINESSSLLNSKRVRKNRD